MKKMLNLLIYVMMMGVMGTVALAAEGITELRSGSVWQGAAFGDLGGQTGITGDNFKIVENNNGTVDISVSNNKGKIAGSSDGFLFYYQELERGDNFEFSARVNIGSYNANSQVSFGLMVRDEILINENNGKYNTDYIAAGPLGLSREAEYTFNRRNGKLEREGKFAANPMPGTTLDIKMKKAGDAYELTVGDEEPVVIPEFDFSGEKLYVGMYAVRNTSVNFSDIKLDVDKNTVTNLEVVEPTKTEYLPGEELDLRGIEVTAEYEGSGRTVLSSDDYIVSGFDSTEAGEKEVAIHYNGITEIVKVDVVLLSISQLNVKYYPVKTEYYRGDILETLGLEVEADYNNGYIYKDLASEEYKIYVEGTLVDAENPFEFDKSGDYKMEIVSAERAEAKTTLTITVSNARLRKIEVAELPEVTQYFLDDELDLDGMVAYAVYSNGSKVRLRREDYTVSGFSSDKSGNKTVRVSHKNKRGSFKVNVKEKESLGLKVTAYPKTTVDTGSKLDLDTIVVEELYDNGDLGAVDGISIDTGSVDTSIPGVYEIRITSDNKKIEAATLEVTVRDAVETQWKDIVFGQSTNSTRNYVKKGSEHVEVTALIGGGKITGDHDGISFYYVELDAADNFTLSADINVAEYAKKPHDGQESFGIMARDAIGQNLDSAVFASNMAAIGGFSGGTRDDNGTQLFVRSGVEAPNGEGSQGVQRVMMDNERPGPSNTPYRLTLSKTNSGFTGRIDDGEEFVIYEPEVLTMQNDKMYVGFYAARLATIEVSNIDLQVSVAATDAPKVEKPLEAMTPAVEIESLVRVSEDEYNLMVRPNVDGVVSVKMGSRVIASEVAATKGKLLEVPAMLSDTNTSFSVVFIPEDTQLLTSYDMVVENFTVEMRNYRDGGDIFVSPEGSAKGSGTRENPLDLDTAIDFVEAGQRIVLLEGVYLRHTALEILKYNDGRKDAMKHLVADAGTRPVIDFDRVGRGMVHSGNYWHVYGIDFARSAGNYKGYTLGGNHNIIELSRFYENGDTGFQMSRTDLGASIDEWPSYNLVLNSDSFNNVDPSENNADGFGAKLTLGRGNVFDGCMAYNNIDDGWDLYTKVGGGAIGSVVIRNSVAYNNGYVMGRKPGLGDGNGFKLGGEGVHVPHLITNSVSFGNIANGYSSNSNPGVIAKDNIAFNNQRNALFVTYTDIKEDFQVEGFVSIHMDNPLDEVRDNVPQENYNETNFFFNGKVSENTEGKKLKEADYTNVDMPEVVSRNADGSINFDFLGNLSK